MNRRINPPTDSTRAFSLVELSIVLVIIGLLAGGVIGGQSLIRASELRSVTAQYSLFRTAINSFKDKYISLPGDIPNATQFWGSNGAANCSISPATDKTTCNGNGDSIIYPHCTAGGCDTSGSTSNEQFRFWQHLANAGLIEGQFSGTKFSTPTDLATGNTRSVGDTNAPKAKFGNGFWAVESDGSRSIVIAPNPDPDTAGNGKYYNIDYGNHFMLGAISTNNPPAKPLFTPEETWNIDTKMDDGVGGKGAVIAHRKNQCTNATDNDDVNATYKLDVKSKVCAMIFTKVF